MYNFLIKFFNISLIIFLINIFLFNLLTKILPIEYALISTLIIIFILNFLFICYSFDIKKNKVYFFFGLIFISISFRFIEYNLFINLIQIFKDPALAWFITILNTYILKFFVYKLYINLHFFNEDMIKKKIFIFSPSLNKGGAEKNIYLLTKLLIKQQNEVTLVLWEQIYSKLNEPNLKKIIIDKNDLKSSFFSILFLIVKNNPDYIFSSHNHLNIFLGLIRIISGVKSKQIIRESNLLSLKLKDELNQKKLKIFLRKFLTKITYNNSDIIICPSNAILLDLNKNFSIKRKKLKYLHNLFEKNLPHNTKSSFSKKKYLIAIGRLELQKDYTFMLHAFYKSLKHKDNKLLIFGNGSEKEKINNLIKKLSLKKNVKLMSFKSSITSYIHNAQAVLLTSNYEGMPNVILEATSLGVKCLLTNFPGSSFFNRYENIKITKKNIKSYSSEIIKLNSKRIVPKSFINDFEKNKNKKKFLTFFK